jgi:hypothetical protein
MPDSSERKWPETIEVWDQGVLNYISDMDRMTPSTEWKEVAEYKLIRVRRVRHERQWSSR